MGTVAKRHEKIYYTYLSSTNFFIWLERKGSFFRFDVRNDANVGRNVDIWRVMLLELGELTGTSPLTGAFSSPVDITVETSQWEHAVQPDGAADFMGGFHGDEIKQSVLFLLDGKAISLPTTAQEVDAFEMTQHSHVFDPSDGVTKLADVYVRHRWTYEGLKIEVSYEWVTAATITTAYAGMLPSLNNDDVSSTAKFNLRANTIDLSESVSTFSVSGTQDYGVSFWNGNNTIALSVEITPAWFGYDSGYGSPEINIVHTQGLNNKAYPCKILAGTASVASGDIWYCEAFYRLYK